MCRGSVSLNIILNIKNMHMCDGGAAICALHSTDKAKWFSMAEMEYRKLPYFSLHKMHFSIRRTKFLGEENRKK